MSQPRFDSFTKVTGKEKYAIDYYMENMLLAGIKRAYVPHGKIKNIDISSAEKLPGVYKILTGKDVPGSNRQGIIHKDMPVIADQKVHYAGDAVALILAENKEVLKNALKLIKTDIEPLPGIFDVNTALKPDAPLVHEENENGNILLKAEIKNGDSIEAFKECAVIIEETFETPVQCHAFIETENGIAYMEKDGTIVMTVSTQSPFRDRLEIAQALGLDFQKIRIISPHLGGGFGGKDGATVQCFLALAAINSGGRPVKMVWDREEHFVSGYKRHGTLLKYKIGAKADGTIHSLHCRLYYDTGAYAHLGGEVMGLGMEQAGGPYRIPNTLVEGWCIYTNNPIGGAMRTFGIAQVSFAFERLMDMMAEKLGMDPLEIRLKNVVRKGDKNCSGITLKYSTGIMECLEKLKAHSLWKERKEWKKEAPLFKHRGIGIGAVISGIGYGKNMRDSAIAKIELTEKGKIRVYSGVSDMGQGNSSTYIQIAREILCQDMYSMELIQPDTERSLPCGSSSAARTTYTYGNALIKASMDLKDRILNRAGMILFIDNDDDLRLVSGKVVHPGGKEISLERLASFMNEHERICINHFVAPVYKNKLHTGKEFFAGFPHIIFSHSAHLVYIEIDELTGMAEVKKYLAITDAGKVINQSVYEQQVHGGISQGLGYGLMEDFIVKNGEILTDNFSTYIIPASMDLPDIISIPVEIPEPTGPLGMKGIGEICMNGPLPAVANALYDAGKIHIKNPPFTGEKILKKLTKD